MSTTNGTFDKDPEKLGAPEDPPVARGTATEAWDTEPEPKAPWQRRFVDSFRRDPNAHIIKPGQSLDPHGGHGFDHKTAAERTANSGLAHKLKSRHMQMVSELAQGPPQRSDAYFLLCYVMLCYILFCFFGFVLFSFKRERLMDYTARDYV